MTTGILFAGWTVLVLAGYLHGHPFFLNADWIRKSFLPPCDPWNAPFLGERIRQVVVAAPVSVLFLLGVAAVGRRMARWLGVTSPGLVELLIGWGTLALAWLGAGLVGGWFAPVAWAVLLIGALDGLRFVRRIGVFRPAWWMLLMLPVAWVTLAGALSPETELDAIRYHLGLPRLFALHHRVFVPERMLFASFPLNASMVFGAVGLAAGDGAAKLLNWALLWIIAGLTARLAGGGVPGRIAAGLWLGVPVVAIHAAIGFAELTTTAFLSAAVVLLHESRSRTRAVLGSAVLAGFALGTSYRAAQGVLPIALLWWITTCRIRTPVIFGLAALAATAPWELKNWLATGNPVHPLASGRLGSLENESAALASSMFRLADVFPPGAIPGAGLWTYLTAGDRQGSYPFGPVAGIILPVIVAAAVFRRDRLAAYALAFIGCWVATTPGWGRYLLGALPEALAAATAFLYAELRLTPRVRAMAFGLMAFTAGTGIWLGAEVVFMRKHPIPHVCGCESSAEYVAARILPVPYGDRIMKATDALLPKTAHVYLWGIIETAFLPRTGHADYEHSEPLFQALVHDSADDRVLRKRFRERRFDALLYSAAGGVSQAASSSLLPWTPDMVTRWQSFVRRYLVLRHAIELESANAFYYLYEIRPTPVESARLPHGAGWPHLPGMERILRPGDIAYDRRELREALRLYESAAKDFPNYAWAWQRIAAVASELGDRTRVAAATARSRSLGG